MKKKIVIFGAGGNIGHITARQMSKRYDVICLINSFCPPGIDGRVVDITDQKAVEDLLQSEQPEVVINLAAMADADACQNNAQLVRRVNIDGTGIVASASARIDAHLLHYSTDLVFDGLRGNYTEGDKPAPLSLYAETKLASEQVALDKNEKTSVVRTALVYGAGAGNRANFFEATLERARRGEPSGLFTDQFRSFLYVHDSPAALSAIIEQGLTGLYHLAGDERISRYDFTRRVFEQAGLPSDLAQPIRMADIKTAAPRPADCSLNNSKLKSDSGWQPRSMEKAVNHFLRKSS